MLQLAFDLDPVWWDGPRQSDRSSHVGKESPSSSRLNSGRTAELRTYSPVTICGRRDGPDVLLVDLIATSHSKEAKLRAEVLTLRRRVQVLDWQVKRVRWEPGDRMILAALRERLPRSAWAALLVQPETVLGWHRELIRRRWATYRGRPRTGRPPMAEEVRELIVRMARENSRWG